MRIERYKENYSGKIEIICKYKKFDVSNTFNDRRYECDKHTCIFKMDTRICSVVEEFTYLDWTSFITYRGNGIIQKGDLKNEEENVDKEAGSFKVD